MIVIPVRKNYLIDQGQGFRDTRQLIAGGVGVNFGGCSVAMNLRVQPEDPLPIIAVTGLPSSSGFAAIDVYGNYAWDVYPSALSALNSLQRALYFAFRVFWADGVHRDDLITGTLYLSRNLVFP